MAVEVLVRRQCFVLFALVSLSIATAFNVNAQQIDPKTYGGMKWRLVGPFRGGRVLTVAGVPSEPNTYYFGAVAGGVWKRWRQYLGSPFRQASHLFDWQHCCF